MIKNNLNNCKTAHIPMKLTILDVNPPLCNYARFGSSDILIIQILIFRLLLLLDIVLLLFTYVITQSDNVSLPLYIQTFQLLYDAF
jgi:hypothetical protein